jgi:hypothetical protein
MHLVTCTCGHIGFVGDAWVGRVLACTGCGSSGLPQRTVRLVAPPHAEPMQVIGAKEAASALAEALCYADAKRQTKQTNNAKL